MSTPPKSVDLADIREFAKVVTPLRKSHANSGPTYTGFTQADGLYCAVCGGRRRMSIHRLHWNAQYSDGTDMKFERASEAFKP